MLYCDDYRLAMIFVASSTASGPPFSLRLGHARGLTAHRAVIQHPRAASLPTGEGIRAQRGETPHPPTSWAPSPTGEGIRAQRGVREKRVRKSNFMNKTLFYK